MTGAPTIREVRLSVVEATWRATWLTLEVLDGEAAAGLGECSGAGAPSTVREDVRALASRLHGRTTTDARQDAELTAGLPGPLAHAVDLALADLDARAAGAALDVLPAGRHRSRVPLYANINRAERDRTSPKLAAVGARAVAEGFRAVKLAPFDDADAAGGLAHLRALRSAIGPDVELMVDCHHRLPLREMLRILPELERLGVVWLEDAAALGDVEGWRAVAAGTGMPLAAGEQATGLADVEALLHAGVLAAVLPDVKIAGVRGCLEILERARELGIRCSLHNPTGPVATAASLLIAAAVPAFDRLEFAYGEVPWRGGLLIPEERVEDGRLAVPQGPGLGVALSPRARLQPPD